MKNPDISFEDAKARKKKGSQGKSAESAVQKLLDQRRREGKLDFIRLLDSRAAGRTVAAQPCDFIVFAPGNTIALEVKQVSKGDRLPNQSFTQLPRMAALARQKVTAVLLVFLLETNTWWAVDVGSMSPAPSWKVGGEGWRGHSSCDIFLDLNQSNV